jgi:transposase
MSIERIANFLLLPELEFIEARAANIYVVQKTSQSEVCPKCATLCSTAYDKRMVSIKDAPIRQLPVTLMIVKRRFFCKSCKLPFTEPVPGILPRKRSTQRLRAEVSWACSKFINLTEVRETYRVSNRFIYQAHFEALKYSRLKHQPTQWPEHIGIDEHYVGKQPKSTFPRFVTLIADHKRKRLIDVVDGKRAADVVEAVRELPGRENVRSITMDLCEPYRNVAIELFPQALRIADKFHVLKLLTPVIFKERRAIVGKNADKRARGLLLMSSKKLDYLDRLTINRYLEKHPKLEALYEFKESLHNLYRILHPKAAQNALDAILITAAMSPYPEIKTLGRTLSRWREEVLNYFHRRATNARLEGFNNKASLLRKQAYGVKNIDYYRLRLLNACS